jgi:hypothetical protein
MAWTDPPDFTTGQILTAAEMDIISDDLTDLKTETEHRLEVSGRTASVAYGTPPTIEIGGFLFQFGTEVVTLDGSSNGTITFPESFPAGLGTVVANNGDPNVAEFSVDVGGALNTGFDFHCHGPATNPNGLDVRVNWLAVGW